MYLLTRTSSVTVMKICILIDCVVVPCTLSTITLSFYLSLTPHTQPAVQFFANPYMGSVVDEHGPRNPMLAGATLLCFSSFLLAFGVRSSNSIHIVYTAALISKALQGLASAMLTSAGMTLCALTHHDCNRGTAMGLAMVGVAMGSMLGPSV